MEVTISRTFIKDLKTAPKPTQLAADAVIRKLIEAKSLQTSGVDYTKMEGQKKGENYYRVRVGDWRMGIEYMHPKLIVIRILARGTIYKHFPPGN
ncbi:MAG TPA: type II toxin-antitoxin system RelE/ParE family toxin [Puia sp.]|jgi:mRNA interferase RelE/StbE|nr:type II toxin-antitoxin system RelE/ParE family toxin [Puia sp.]